jgi:hypothetical protein
LEVAYIELLLLVRCKVRHEERIESEKKFVRILFGEAGIVVAFDVVVVALVVEVVVLVVEVVYELVVIVMVD